jgi:hypothetical protein
VLIGFKTKWLGKLSETRRIKEVRKRKSVICVGHMVLLQL